MLELLLTEVWKRHQRRFFHYTPGKIACFYRNIYTQIVHGVNTHCHWDAIVKYWIWQDLIKECSWAKQNLSWAVLCRKGWGQHHILLYLEMPNLLYLKRKISRICYPYSFLHSFLFYCCGLNILEHITLTLRVTLPYECSPPFLVKFKKKHFKHVDLKNHL